MAENDPFTSGSLYNRLKALSINSGFNAKSLKATSTSSFKKDAELIREQQINHSQHTQSAIHEILEDFNGLITEEFEQLSDEKTGGAGR